MNTYQAPELAPEFPGTWITIIEGGILPTESGDICITWAISSKQDYRQSCLYHGQATIWDGKVHYYDRYPMGGGPFKISDFTDPVFRNRCEVVAAAIERILAPVKPPELPSWFGYKHLNGGTFRKPNPDEFFLAATDYSRQRIFTMARGSNLDPNLPQQRWIVVDPNSNLKRGYVIQRQWKIGSPDFLCGINSYDTGQLVPPVVFQSRRIAKIEANLLEEHWKTPHIVIPSRNFTFPERKY